MEAEKHLNNTVLRIKNNKKICVLKIELGSKLFKSLKFIIEIKFACSGK